MTNQLNHITAFMGEAEAARQEVEALRARVAELEAKLFEADPSHENHVCRARIAEVEADNAALVRWINEHGHRIGDRLCPYTGGYACEPGCAVHAIHVRPHPGAALLERHATETQQAYMSGVAITSAALMEEHRKALVRARNEGRESAARRAERTIPLRPGCSCPGTISTYIRADMEPEQ